MPAAVNPGLAGIATGRMPGLTSDVAPFATPFAARAAAGFCRAGCCHVLACGCQDFWGGCQDFWGACQDFCGGFQELSPFCQPPEGNHFGSCCHFCSACLSLFHLSQSQTLFGGGASSGAGGTPSFWLYFPLSRMSIFTFASGCEVIGALMAPSCFLKQAMMPASTFSWMLGSAMKLPSSLMYSGILTVFLGSVKGQASLASMAAMIDSKPAVVMALSERCSSYGQVSGATLSNHCAIRDATESSNVGMPKSRILSTRTFVVLNVVNNTSN
mmetsp:Transcript_30786/g.57470  ORF Transcript_30786/g.57470 Transcript_30786/m.57470 type:complete len:271 (+) Transcript_30786:362-1174(+)